MAYLKLNEVWPLVRELCTYLYGRIIGGIPIILVLCNCSTKIDGFEQKDSQGFENSYNSYEQYPLDEIFNFHHLPKLYFGFNPKEAGSFDPIVHSQGGGGVDSTPPSDLGRGAAKNYVIWQHT